MNTFTFERDFETDRVLPVAVGRLIVGGHTIRIFFGPTGIVLTLPTSLKNHPSMRWYDADPELRFGYDLSGEASHDR